MQRSLDDIKEEFRTLKEDTKENQDYESDSQSDTFGPDLYEPIKAETAKYLCLINSDDEATENSTPEKGYIEKNGEINMMKNLLTSISLIEVPMYEPLTPGLDYLMGGHEDLELEGLKLRKNRTYGT